MLDRSQELERIALIEALNVMDPAPGRSLDPVTELAAFTFGTPIALISIVDADSQWLISRVGLSLQRTDRHHSICSCAIQSPGILQIEDLREDPRFSDNPLVTGPESMRFYAGAPLVTRSGIALGTLCLMDRTPRVLSENEQRQLQTLARVVVNQMELKMSLGRRDPVSGLPNRQQFQADLSLLSRKDGASHYTGALVD
ncbi:MAG: GAF domain-containing protein, partial [Stenotrophomonas sp.]